MIASEGPEAQLRAILTVRPDLSGAPKRLHTDGWDSLAIEVAGTIFKFPHTAAARERLVREPKTLDLVRPRIALELPRMRLHTAPMLFTEHAMIEGAQVDPALYASLDRVTRDRLVEDLAVYFADIHRIEPRAVLSQGLDAVRRWPEPGALLASVAPLLSRAQNQAASDLVHRYAAWGEDASVFGHFDTHGWNMGFDLAAGRLTGLYDFAGAGIGPLHRDLSYPTFISPELTVAVIARYGALTGRAVAAERALAAHGMLRVVELAEATGERRPFVERLLAFAAIIEDRTTARTASG